MQLPTPGIYRHYKGPEYHLLEIATHSETEELMAVYRPLYGDQALWVRPLAMWQETVEIDGKTLPRFQYLREAVGTLARD
ncbi:DUF1653 domain-containing protein [Seongchinamella unica]|uniref:DUF1653 domain-containing protein n=1 Tax=Seongchinamella unica TaxID=2547392 RepID=A0A4R5LVG5_9GAMM|nr:DUF1653 domain-containing protein [Seongchinamella unica]TDG15208.1 DUF1653 domain-containing protein [Seongchinamella unica]